jgi:peroxiredoxin Q/BCP
MSTSESESADLAPGFELPNVGVGPDPLTLDRIADRADVAVLLLLRDYHCPKCKAQVRAMTESAKTFAERNAVVVPILPEPRERAAAWDPGVDVPFPLLADPAKELADDYDQPTRFGALGKLHDMVGRMPETVVLDTRGDRAEVAYTYEGKTPTDRPAVEAVVEEVEALQESFVFDCDLVDC